MEDGIIPFREVKQRAQVLQKEFNWDKGVSTRIWGFGPIGDESNILVDLTQGCQYLNEVKEHIYGGFL